MPLKSSTLVSELLCPAACGTSSSGTPSSNNEVIPVTRNKCGDMRRDNPASLSRGEPVWTRAARRALWSSSAMARPWPCYWFRTTTMTWNGLCWSVHLASNRSSTAPGKASRKGRACPRQTSGTLFANARKNEKQPERKAGESSAPASRRVSSLDGSDPDGVPMPMPTPRPCGSSGAVPVTNSGIRALVREIPFSGENHAHFIYHAAWF